MPSSRMVEVHLYFPLRLKGNEFSNFSVGFGVGFGRGVVDSFFFKLSRGLQGCIFTCSLVY
jgi:hypothetical protein